MTQQPPTSTVMWLQTGTAGCRANRVRSTIPVSCLRSALVSGWPGLRVKAYGEQGKELTPAPGETESGRRITPDILLYLVEGIIHRVTFQEPSEGIHFGLDKTSEGTIAPKKSLRKAVNGPDLGKDAGEVAVSPAAFRPPLQGKDYQVLKIDDLAQKMTEALGSNANRFTPAEFALEMIEGVEGVTVEIAKPRGLMRWVSPRTEPLRYLYR